ncbi:rubredoxin [Oscillibacter sp.]|uniref:rubredoxin n=1 Tax=Oscillibacter sp. TaxID=1945593 RepID=UPI0028A057D4|nr:rubredoxin [Oscillibacter sp.]
MVKYVCSICGFIYDEAKGIPEAGIAPGTAWEVLPEDWICPLCGAAKSEFDKQKEPATTPKMEQISVIESFADMKEMSPLEVSALCTNLARGCEKQYKPEEAALFRELAGYFKSASAPAEEPGFDKLIALIEKDLQEGFPNANAVASNVKDRGALRALVWSEKVTRMLKSILGRYQKEGDTMLENTGVYVCTICGFIYIGNALPQGCPVCKVPNWKFEMIEGRQ